MRHGKLAILLAVAAAGALCCGTGAQARGMTSAARAGGFVHHQGFHRHPVPVGFARFRLRRRIPLAGFRGFRDSTVTVASDDDTDDYDTGDEDFGGDLADMHFRVQDSFGPWDVPIRPVVAEPPGPYTAERMDPWHGYEPQDDW